MDYDLPISDKLREQGISKIRKEGLTVCIEYHDTKQNDDRCIRFDIAKLCGKTIENFEKMANGAFLPITIQHVNSLISGEWNKLKPFDNTTSTSTDTTSGPQVDEKELRGLSVSQAIRAKKGYVRVSGTLIGQSSVYGMVAGTCESHCLNCDTTRPAKLFNKPIYSMKKDLQPCSHCNEGSVPIAFEYCSTVDVEIQDPDKFNEMERLSVRLFEKDTENVIVGENVIITGNLHMERKNDNPRNRPTTTLYALSIEYTNRETLELTSKDIEDIQKWKASKEAEGIEPIDALVSIFSPCVIRNEHVKEGILMTLANAGIPNSDKRVPIRLRIHHLMIGDPSTAKSVLLRGATNIMPNSRYESCQSSTGLSLTAQVSKEDGLYNLRTGPIPQAKGSVCGLNEIGQMPISDHKHFLDSMEEGSFTINKHGFNSRIQAHTSIIATANPIGNTWNHPEAISEDDFPTLKQILHRFDIVSIFKEVRDATELRQYTRKRDQIIKDLADGKYDGYEELLRKYLIHAQTFNPTISEEAKSMLYDYWVKMADKGVRGLPRKLESLERAIIARAKLKLKNVADVQEATEVQDFFNTQLVHYQQHSPVSVSPSIVAFQECLRLLFERKEWPIEFVELLKTICKQNEQIKHYIGSDLRLNENWKMRNIRDLLVNHSSVEIIGERPTVLKWKVIEDKDRSEASVVSEAPKIGVDEKNKNKASDEEGSKNIFDVSAPKGTSHTSLTSLDGGLNTPISSLPKEFDELESRSPDGIVSYDDLEASLIATGDYSHNTALIFILEMVRDKRLVQVEYLRYKRSSQAQKEVV